MFNNRAKDDRKGTGRWPVEVLIISSLLFLLVHRFFRIYSEFLHILPVIIMSAVIFVDVVRTRLPYKTYHAIILSYLLVTFLAVFRFTVFIEDHVVGYLYYLFNYIIPLVFFIWLIQDGIAHGYRPSFYKRIYLSACFILVLSYTIEYITVNFLNLNIYAHLYAYWEMVGN